MPGHQPLVPEEGCPGRQRALFPVRDDYRADEQHPVQPVRDAVNHALRNVSAVGLPGHEETAFWYDLFREPYDGFQHPVGVYDVVVAPGLSHARQVEVDAFPARASPEDRLHAAGHYVVVDAEAVDHQDGDALPVCLVVYFKAVDVAYHVYHNGLKELKKVLPVAYGFSPESMPLPCFIQALRAIGR